jgi:hypothetical protein
MVKSRPVSGWAYLDQELLHDIRVPFVERTSEIGTGGRAELYIPTELVNAILLTRLKYSTPEIKIFNTTCTETEFLALVEQIRSYPNNLCVPVDVNSLNNVIKASTLAAIFQQIKKMSQAQITQGQLQHKDMNARVNCGLAQTQQQMPKQSTGHHRMQAHQSFQVNI